MNPVTKKKTTAPETTSTNGGKSQCTGSARSAPVSTDKGTKVTFGATAGMPGRFKGNFDYQFVRTMGCVTYGGAALGECYETASRIEDEKEDSYSEAWRVTAERVEAIARKSLAGGHLVSAREASCGRHRIRPRWVSFNCKLIPSVVRVGSVNGIALCKQEN